MKKLVVLFLILCSCSSSQSEKINLLLDWCPNGIHVPLYAGNNLGIFKKHGVDIHVLKLADPPSSIPYLLSKQADVALYYMPNTLKAAERTDELRVVGYWIKQPLRIFLFRKDAQIEYVRDLNQKSLGGNTESLTVAYAQAVIGKGGVTFQQFRKIQIDLVTALAAKMVDVVTGAFWNVEPYQLRSLGIETRFFHLTDFGIPTYFEHIFLSRHDFLEKNPAFVKKFQSALQECITWSQEHPEEAFEIYRQAHPDKDCKTLDWEKQCWMVTSPILTSNQDPDRSCWEAFHQWMLENGQLGKPVNLDLLIGADK